jgi:hypothetical protein
MKENQSKQKKSSQSAPRITRTILNDIRRGGFKRTLRQDLKDIYHFYLDYETKKRLAQMGRVKRWFFQIFWLLKSLILKLSPIRRILLVVSLILLFMGRSNINVDGGTISFNNILQIGFIFLLIILMLELKDKLLAQDELAVGRTVQQAFIPQRNPSLNGWGIWLYTQPANDVGGDLVDYLKITEDKLQIALADVAGKGLGAALMMAKLQATLRALAPNYRSLAALGAQVNEILCRDGLPNRFASLVYLELESNSNVIRILNAGHMPAIFIQDNKIQEMPRGSPALGLKRGITFNEQRIELKPGEVLFIYSDGITDARNEAGKFFGEKRLMRLLQRDSGLSIEKIGKSILNEVERFIGDARLYDDLSMVILKRISE